MFNTYIAQPIFNVLVAIYALLPGHNLGLAIILFTVLVRVILWPLVKKQLHQTKVMRRVQPELKAIKAKTKGNRQEEARLTMELYKEKGVKPLSSIGVMIIQLPILFALYQGLYHVIKDTHQLYAQAYPFLQHLPWMQHIAHNSHAIDTSLFGLIELTRTPLANGLYWPGIILVLVSAVIQYYASKQLLPDSKDARGLRAILSDAKSGKQADQSEVSAAVGRTTIYVLPVFIFFIGLSLPAALALYWLVSSGMAWIQQSIVLREDEEELEELAGQRSKKNVRKIPEAEVVQEAKAKTKPSKGSGEARVVSISSGTADATSKPQTKTTKKSKSAKSKKRRKR